MTFAVCFIIAAFLLYSTAIWAEKITKQLKRWIIITFLCGFSCDYTGTLIMFFNSTGNTLDLHAKIGYLALIIMFIHLVWAICALNAKSQRTKKLFNRYSVYAWGIWMIAFFTGIPK